MRTISASDKLPAFSYCKLLTPYISPPYPNSWSWKCCESLMEMKNYWWKYRWPRNTSSLPECWQQKGWYPSNQRSDIKPSKWKPGFLPQGFCCFLSPPCPLSSLCTLSSLSLTSQPAAELSTARLNLLECLDCSCLSTAPSGWTAGFPCWELPQPRAERQK